MTQGFFAVLMVWLMELMFTALSMAIHSGVLGISYFLEILDLFLCCSFSNDALKCLTHFTIT